MRLPLIAIWCAGCAFAVGVEFLAGPGDVGDLAVAVAFLSAAWLVPAERGPLRALFVLTGLAWSAGTLDEALLYLHRGPLVHLLLAYPTGRLRSRWVLGLAAVAYADGLSVEVAQIGLLTAVLAGSVVLAARGRARAAAALIAALLIVNDLHVADAELVLLGYELTLVLVAVSLALASRAPAVTDLVVELGAAPRSGPLREALARALDDPSLEIGFWADGTLVDAAGAPMGLPAETSGRAVAAIDSVAVIVHDAEVSSGPRLTEAVDRAARLAAANARLHAELRTRATELERARCRVVEVDDAQRSRLERRLSHAADVHLQAMRDALAQAQPSTALAVVERELDLAVADLQALARGIHPHTLTAAGLAAALAELAATSPVAVALEVSEERFPAAIEATAYFVAAEALANVAKYAGVTQAGVEVRREPRRLCVAVSDAGLGGADPERGSGLRGLADRVQAVGGRFVVQSPASGGTSVRAELPL